MAKPTSNPNGLLTVQQAAACIPCSESTVKRRIRSGELPATKFGESGRKYFISPADLEKAMVNAMFGKTAQGIAEQSEDERLEAIARALAAEAPELTAERKAKLASLLSNQRS